MNDEDVCRDVIRQDMAVFAERQRQRAGQADRYRILQTYSQWFPDIDLQIIETMVLAEAERAGVHL